VVPVVGVSSWSVTGYWKEKVKAGDKEPLDMLVLQMWEEKDAVIGGLTAPFILMPRTTSHFLL
jgi:hypothetical protein